MAEYNASIQIMTAIKGYDSWKLDIPDPPEETKPYEVAVHSRRGIFAWQDFCLKEQQNDVPDWAWEACRSGPFVTTMAKLVFAWNLFLARLEGEKNPIHGAGWRSIGVVQPEYFDACNEVEAAWRCKFSEFSLMAVQEQDYTINLYACDFEEIE